jgi:hypothetical protein
MNREQIVRMAWDNGYMMRDKEIDHLMPLFQAIAAAKQEQCAQVCEIVWDSRVGLESGTAIECAAAVRALSD